MCVCVWGGGGGGGGGETLALWCKIDECLKNSCQTRVFLVFFALFYS